VNHVDYPHEPGYLYDCLACESECFCESDAVEGGTQAPCIFCCNYKESQGVTVSDLSTVVNPTSDVMSSFWYSTSFMDHESVLLFARGPDDDHNGGEVIEYDHTNDTYVIEVFNSKGLRPVRPEDVTLAIRLRHWA
jgi:hypothetical protein